VQMTAPTAFDHYADTRVVRVDYDRLRALAAPVAGGVPEARAARAARVDRRARAARTARPVAMPRSAPSPWRAGTWLMTAAPLALRTSPSTTAAAALPRRLPKDWAVRLLAGPVIADRMVWWPVVVLAPSLDVVRGWVPEFSARGVPLLR